MALKSAEINEFLESGLLPQVTEALGEVAESDQRALQAELDELNVTLEKAGVKNIEDAEQVQNLKARIEIAKEDQQTEADTYNHLYNFFSRYYNEGDFVSLRRYKRAGKEAYCIPYNGEEMKLHWANSDQYYIKTTENYASYIFTVDEGKKKSRVRLQIAEADNEQDTIKGASNGRRFFVLSEEPITKEKDELIIHFDHRPLTKREETLYLVNTNRQAYINQENEKRILRQAKKIDDRWLHLLAAPCAVDSVDDGRTLLGKHMAAYTAKNSFDYFIHKDLGAFLHRELEYYIKSEVIFSTNLELIDDSIEFKRNLNQAKAIKKIGGKIIDFLAQIEEFQKQLWLKKKFVIETQYCITVDKVPQELYPKILENKAQVKEWIKLYAIDDLDSGHVAAFYDESLCIRFLKENPYLVLDTRHFDEEFTDTLLAALSDAGPIEEQLSGLLIHGENFQALNLVQERYREQIKCIYIDPPYNTNASAILYKNGYRHSSWMTLMENRLAIGRSFLVQDGSQIVAIDDTEFVVLSQILDRTFSGYDRNVIVVRHHPAGAGLAGANVSETHEYAIFMTPSGQKVLLGEPKSVHAGIDDLIGFRRTGAAESNLRTGRPNSFYSVLVDPERSKVVGAEPPPYTNDYPRGITPEGYVRIYPISEDGTERVWRKSYKSGLKEIEKGNLICKRGRTLYIKSSKKEAYKPIYSNWTEKKYNAGVHGTNVLKNIVGDNLFSYPKSIHTVRDCINHVIRQDSQPTILDYFAGSGTSAHAIIDLNREDGGNRKYILVEIERYFESVLLPRIKKVIYSKEWKEGKPVDREGISQFLRYIRLESYEDTLDSLIINSRWDLISSIEHRQFAEDYRLRYALDEEASGSASLVGQDFVDPFNYTLSVVRDGTRRDVNVDLAETFNFLLGLQVVSRRRIDGVLAIVGTTAKNGENCLILWRDVEKMDALGLNKWFGQHRQVFGNDLRLIYVNGDHTLNSLRKPGDRWRAVTCEPVFQELMFEGAK